MPTQALAVIPKAEREQIPPILAGHEWIWRIVVLALLIFCAFIL